MRHKWRDAYDGGIICTHMAGSNVGQDELEGAAVSRPFEDVHVDCTCRRGGSLDHNPRVGGR